MRCFVETRVLRVLPFWTKEGCNGRRLIPGFGGEWDPYPDESAARVAILERKTRRDLFDDPMWAEAEYRIVPAGKSGRPARTQSWNRDDAVEPR